MSEYKNRKFVTPGIGTAFFPWLRVLSSCKKDPIPWKYKARAAVVTSISMVLSPFRWWESLQFKTKVAQTELHPEPVIILGHWRSGTTHLHNLLSLDPQFGYLTYLHSVFPHAFMGNGVIPWVMKKMLPPVRPMDQMKISIDSPQECDLGLLNYGPYSFYHGWHFPRQQQELFDRFVLFEGMDPSEKEAWEQTFYRMLQKAALFQKKSRLVLKNPPHTARISTLLKLFPRAKFIHIYRNPFTVYASTLNLHRKVTPVFQLQEVSDAQLQKNTLLFYEKLMQRWFEDRSLIPSENLIEVRYETFTQDREAGLRKIYEGLGLQGYEQNVPIWREYLSQKRSFKKAKYEVSKEEIAAVEQRWAFTLEKWGYENPYT